MDGVASIHVVGAEADVRSDAWLGRPTVTKHRIVKAYRHPELDAALRTERLRAEAGVMAAARAAGVPVPVIFDVDMTAATLRMERIPGPTLRESLAVDPDGAARRLRHWGMSVGRLHAAGLTHGDLTTSNAIVDGDRVVLIDFGLAARTKDVEDHGVDLVLVQRTLESTHPTRAAAWFGAMLDGYRGGNPAAQAAVERMREIRGRARYV